MSRLRLLAATGVAALALAAARPVQAQSATVNVSATVQTPLTVATTRPLDFTTVFPGLAKTITPAGATSGLVQVTGQASAQVSVSFVTPANLTNGANNLPITFGGTAACHNTTNSTSGCTSFDPAGAAVTPLLGTTGGLFVFVGGTVTPSATQVAGTYTGTITMNVAYTGN